MKGFYDLHIGIQSWNGIPTCVPRAEIEKKKQMFHYFPYNFCKNN